MHKKDSNTVREWFNTIFYGGLIAIIFRSLLLEPFNIPSGSMIPTLQVGDHIFVQKWAYGYSRYSFPFGSWKLWKGRFFASKEPNVGDIVVFRNPTNESVDYVKRLIGKPGDTIQMIDGRLNINGTQVVRNNARPYIIARLPKNLRGIGYYKDDISIKGNKLLVDNKPATFNYTIEYESNCVLDDGHCGIYKMTEYDEVLPNGVKHSIIELSDNNGFADNTPLYKVPENSYFFMGDDRDFSFDSRWGKEQNGIGYVPRDNVLGKVWFIWYSHNYYAPLLAVWSWGNKIRWDRLGKGMSN